MNGRTAPYRWHALWGAAGFLLLQPQPVAAHWTRPEDLIAGLATDAQLRDRVGVVSVERQSGLPRLLVIKVRRDRWQSIPPEERKQLAEEWLETWRHNVPEGIVAVLDAASEQGVVDFDPAGQARMVNPPAAATLSRTPRP